jgi:hypothetical protein
MAHAKKETTKPHVNIVKEKKEVEATTSVTKIETKAGNIVLIPGVKVTELSTLLIGTRPLIVHSFSEKTRRRILEKHMGEASEGREKKNPIANYEAAKYYNADHSWEGIPAAGLKGMIVDGFDKSTGVPKTRAVGSIRVLPDCLPTNLVRLILPKEPEWLAKRPHFPDEIGRVPRCREDVMRNESGVVDIRHRPEYWPWAILLRIEFLSSHMSERQLLQAVALSGYNVGQCEWRPKSKMSKTGSYGTLRMATVEEVRMFEADRLFADHEWLVPEQREAAE